MLEVPKKNLSLHLKIKIITIENILWHTKNYEVRFESLDFFVLASILARILGRFQIAKLPRKLLKKEFMMVFIFSLFFSQFFLVLFASLRKQTKWSKLNLLVTNGARGRMNFQKTAGRSGRETKYLQAARPRPLSVNVCLCPRPISPRRLSVLSSQFSTTIILQSCYIFGLRNERPAPRLATRYSKFKPFFNRKFTKRIILRKNHP